MFNKAIYNTIGFFRHKKSVQIFNAIMKAENSNIIIDNLYLGNIIDAHNLSFLVNNNIGAIINCTENEPFHQYFNINDDNKKYSLRLDIKDSKDEENVEKFMNVIINKFTSYYKSDTTFDEFLKNLELIAKTTNNNIY